MTLTEGVIILQRLNEKLAVAEDYEGVQQVSFVIQQIKDEQNKKGRKRWMKN